MAGFDVTGFDLHLLLRHWDWPDWLSLSAVGEFITAPEAFVQAAADGASGLAYSPADLGVSDLFDGAEQLLKLHSVLAFAKPIMATLLMGWLWAAAQLQGLGPAQMVSFGDCTPQQKELQQLEAQGLPEGWTRAWDAASAGARAPPPKLLRIGAATRPPLGWAKTMTRPDGLASLLLRVHPLSMIARGAS